MLLVSYIQQYVNTSITGADKSGLKVADCTAQNAEYSCFYGAGVSSPFGRDGAISTSVCHVNHYVPLLMGQMWVSILT